MDPIDVALARYKGDVLPLLLEWANGYDPEAVKEAAGDFIPQITGALRDERVQDIAATALGLIRAVDAVPALLNALTAPRSVLRERACTALANIGDPRATSPIAHALLNDPEVNVATVAAEALGKLRAAHLVPELAPLVHARDHRQYRAIKALGAIGGEEAVNPLLAVITQDPSAVPEALRSLRRIGSRASLSIIHSLLRSPDSAVRYNATLALEKIPGKDVDEILSEAAKDMDPWLRNGAKEALEGRPAPAFKGDTDVVVGFLQAGSAAERATAADVAATLGVSEAIPFLVDALKDHKRVGHDDEGTVADHAVDALAALGESALPALEQAAKAKAKAVRHGALTALARSSAPRGRDILARIAAEVSGDTRIAALEAIAEGPADSAIPTVIQSLGAQSERERAAALFALRMFETSSIPVDAHAAVIASLHDPHQDVRLHAAATAGDLMIRQAAPALANLLTDAIGEIATAAARSLEALRDPTSAPALFQAAASERKHVAHASMKALLRLGDDALPAAHSADGAAKHIAAKIIEIAAARRLLAPRNAPATGD